MPIVELIRPRLEAVKGWPGFTAEALEELKSKHRNNTARERLCSIVLDRMSIRKICELDVLSGHLIGFIDLGNSQGPTDADNVPLATDSPVFMVVGLAAFWKMTFGYFLAAGLPGETVLWRHRKALHKLQDKEGLSASHKLSKAHIDYYQQLSSFDLLNSSNPIATSYKAPLRPATFAYQREVMDTAGQHLIELWLATKRLVRSVSRANKQKRLDSAREHLQ
ncbi:hypothetical protein HPB50_011239 [Hyalomma asiaticum]|uniref:Uncharacterized protein n=1 Tax=Hyalomma asiaticum TaxID=266040 RepID=A0ACB7SDP6_HYAAI|nr:hypothetical protein HPB50_011239 [Hyalomma asiaticum]